MGLLSRKAFAVVLGSIILFQTAKASAPPPNVTIDYTVGALSKSRYLKDMYTINGHDAALDQDFPDPTTIQVGNKWWAFGTGALGMNIQVASKQGGGAWSLAAGVDALPTLPRWVERRDPQVWAPSVTRISPDSYVLYYAAKQPEGRNVHCIGTATSRTPQGPYTASDVPFACHAPDGGAIDASGFVDPRTGARYVAYKVDGNNLGHGGNCNNAVPPLRSTPIMLQRVGADGVTKLGEPRQIADRDVADGPLVEAPNIVVLAGKYFLFFSSNCYVTDMYDVSYAVADRVEGPYTKRGPLILSKTFGMHGPGGAEVVATGEREGYLVFHAGPVGRRVMYEGRLEYLGGTRLRFCLGDGACTEAD